MSVNIDYLKNLPTPSYTHEQLHEALKTANPYIYGTIDLENDLNGPSGELYAPQILLTHIEVEPSVDGSHAFQALAVNVDTEDLSIECSGRFHAHGVDPAILQAVAFEYMSHLAELVHGTSGEKEDIIYFTAERWAVYDRENKKIHFAYPINGVEEEVLIPTVDELTAGKTTTTTFG